MRHAKGSHKHDRFYEVALLYFFGMYIEKSKIKC